MSVVVSVQSKVCSKCGEVKTLDGFSKQNASKDGYQSHCRICVMEQSAKYYAASLEKKKEYRENPAKKCSQCNETKNKGEFHIRASNKNDGYDTKCKVCKKVYESYLIDETEQYQQTPELSQSKIKELEARFEVSKRKGLIYIFRDAANKALKIGFTTNLKGRTSHHMGSNPFLVLLDVIDNVTIQLEYEIHARLNFHRIPGTTEWYRDDAQVLSLFADYKIKCKLESDLIS